MAVEAVSVKVTVEIAEGSKAMSVQRTQDSQTGVLPANHTKEDTKSFYNSIASVYDMLAERSERSLRRTGVNRLAPRAGESLLEIGFGTGHTLVELAEAVGSDGKVYGVDLAENMVAAATNRMRQEELSDRVDLICGDAMQLPFDANTMDGIIMIFTLELFDVVDIPRVLFECHRVLRPGGRIVVIGMSKEGKQGVAVHTFEWFHRLFPHLMDCRPIYVRRALESADFRIDSAKIEYMWVAVEIVSATKAQRAADVRQNAGSRKSTTIAGRLANGLE